MRKEEGFTIIEVVITLAISFMLFGAVTYAGIQMTQNAQFTDTMASTASFIQNQYEEARSGVSPQGFGNTKDNQQLLRGKLIYFNGNNMETYFVVSDKTAFVPDVVAASGLKVNEGKLHIINEGQRKESFAYNANFSPVHYGDYIPNAILILRAIDSAVISYYTLHLDESPEENNEIKLAVDGKNSAAAFIVKNTVGGQHHVGVVCVDPGVSSGVIHTYQGLDSIRNYLDDGNSVDPGIVHGAVEEKCKS